MQTVRPKLAVRLGAALLLSTLAAFPATEATLAGSIAGIVRNGTGVPQMGASVFLFNRSERLILRGITNEHGVFGFALLPPDVYSVRVSLASFVPAVKQKIAVQPGMQSLLYVNLASVLSSIELVYASPGDGALMSDDWKWVLKESASTRPVLRMLPGMDIPDPSQTSTSDPDQRQSPVGSALADTRGVFNVSAGDAGSLGSSSAQSDMGTAFALSTSVFGHNQVQLSGDVGYSAHSGLPAAGFRTSYSHDGSAPVVSATVQQVYLTGATDGAPAFRTMSVSMHDSRMLTDSLRLDYGGSFDSVSYVDHLNSLSKFGRLTYDLGRGGKVKVAFSTGGPPTELLMSSEDAQSPSRGDSEALAQDLAALAVLPRLSLLDGHAAVQRSRDVEIGYEKKIHATTLNITGYSERVSNAAMIVVAPDGAFAAGDLLPDISSQNSILDAGTFHRLGFASSATRALGDRVQVGVSFGSSGALAAGNEISNTADALRDRLQTAQRFWASARASAKLPVTGTVITGSYEWMDYNDTIMPDHVYLTDSPYAATGLNVRVRQPIPSVPGMPGRLEATAELQNGLAQGYMPIMQGGQQVTLVQSPRALRGGLSFIF
ncbi:MAG TPA: carboxypeptidase-like regulatory domain-containing protein [Bryobacteraceae bacterium]|jgi:Carboxypeptidase regulatory-like domain|nr:carboxypeptidase-like regulatory domain-containing protein [Bryobacteraceae bacterium]